MKKVGREITQILFFICVFCATMISAQNDTSSKKSSINITYPISTSVWETSELAELRWTTKNMDTTKFIRFFLVRNKTMVQELGRFKNTGYASGIRLAKNIGSGTSYQVMGIELFPDNKEQIAKFATPFFSIKNKESDERKRQALLARDTQNPSNQEKKKERKKLKKAASLAVESTPNLDNTFPKEFDGRRISYVKNLAFESEYLKVKVWDHDKEDGDIISIYLNGDLVLSEHLLTKDLQEFDIQLDSTKPNDLLLYAHNLGEVSPNTVSVEITSSNKSETITLNSYLRSCEAVLIHVKE